MPSTKVKGIVIGGINVKEKDKLVKLYTLELGKISVAFKGVRAEKAKLKSAKELFCFGDYIIESSKAGHIVTSCDIIDSFHAISKDIQKYYEACAILNIVDKAAYESNPLFFIEVIKSIKSICYDNIKRLYVLDKFLISYFDYSGYRFLSEKCSSCGAKLTKRYFNYDIGELVCPACKTFNCDAVSDSAFTAMKILQNTDYDKLQTVKLGGEGEVQAFNILCKNFEWKTGYKVLKVI